MAIHTLDFWEIALDGIQICLGSFILLYLIRNKIKYKQLVLKAPASEDFKNFNSQIIIQSLRQQAEMAFAHILETINKERQDLEKYFEIRDPQKSDPVLIAAMLDQVQKPELSGSESGFGHPDPTYDQIEKLAQQGLSTADISEKLDIPRGEVELILRLKRYHIETDNISGNNPSI